MTSESRRLAVGTGWTLLSTIVAIGVGALLNPVLVLYVGLSGYGEWAAAIALTSLFGVGGDIGVAGALTKLAAEREGRRQNLGSMAGTALAIGVVCGGLAGGLLAALSPILESGSGYPEFATLLRIQALQMAPNLGIASILSLYQGRRLFRALAGFSIVQVAGSFGLAVAFLTAGYGLAGVMLASLATSSAVFAAAVVLNRQLLTFRGVDAFRDDFRKLVPFGFQLTLTNAFSAALYQIDLVALAFLVHDPQQLGLYALATFATRTLWIIPSSIGTTTYPVVSEYAAANRAARVSRYVSTALTASIAITGVVSSALVLFGRPALAIVFGASAVSSFDLCLLMLCGTAFLGCLRAVASAIPSVGRPEVGLRVSIAGAALLLALSVPLIAVWGAAGAATAVTITFSFVAVLLLWSLQRYVLQPNRLAFHARRAAQTGLLAIALVGASLAFALAPKPTLETTLGAALVLLVGAFALLEISGGRRTWLSLIGRQSGDAADRS